MAATYHSYYRRFVEGCSKIATPMNHLTRKGEKFVWTLQCQESFEELKKRLTQAPVLALPTPGEDFVIYGDASRIGLGCVLMQQENVIVCLKTTQGL